MYTIVCTSMRKCTSLNNLHPKIFYDRICAPSFATPADDTDKTAAQQRVCYYYDYYVFGLDDSEKRAVSLC